MGFFRKHVAEEPEDLLAGTPYQGDSRAVIFREGFYYAVDYDSDGRELGPNTDRKFVWRDGGLHHARPEDPNHFHTYGLNAAEIVPAP